MRLRFALAAALALSLSGCTSLAQVTANVATSLSSSTPTQVTTLAEAINAADLITNSAKVAVDTGRLDAATMKEIDTLSTAVHTALVQLEAANTAGKSLSYAAFQAALDAYLSYSTAEGISH